ncbi:adenine nucleotide alpha hydrolases-like protein [Delitschia confertaspora ATCC 74209]|uniref:FAD synthase n=1 Tax=Delitschia confertaspora ATCC 74209 TaxID=1513339 RepID=A0A9P4MW13_9PLEO|nr:adenine nucleotide alpha hydrolases-like protein [Delitschia confertaspora ATCC 74209]
MTATAAEDPVNELRDHPPVSPLVADEASVPFPVICAKIHDRITTFLTQQNVSPRLKNVQAQTKIALDVISKALDQYTLSELALAYNGGKDCLVLLILFLCALHSKGLTRSGSNNNPEPIQCVYIQAPHPFQEVEDFVAKTVKTYSLSLLEYAKPMKEAFADYLHDHPSVKAIFVGTRRTDPHGELLTHFDPTDHGWPKFMRIHPVIDWHYVDVWTFILRLNIPYCVLYDKGYTSLGGTEDTFPNPALLGIRSSTVDGSVNGTNGMTNGTTNGEGASKYRPAYELVDDYEERLGRDR